MAPSCIWRSFIHYGHDAVSRINAIHHEYLLGQSKLEEVANFQLQLCVPVTGLGL